MSGNYLAPGAVVEVIAPSGGVVSGTFYSVEAVRGVCMVSADAGALFPLRVTGVFALPKLTSAGQLFAAGDAVFDDGSGNCCISATGLSKIGVAYDLAGEADVSVNVRLNPSF